MKKILIVVVMLLLAVPFVYSAERRWMSQPIHVYIPEHGQMSVYMRQAFMAWQNLSGSTVRFKFDSSPSSAKIQVNFVEFVTTCNSNDAVGCTHWYERNGKIQKAVIDIGTKEYIFVTGKGTKTPKKVTRSKNHIYGVMLHEVGHAIGLEHSNNPKSIMYPYDLDSMQYLTKEDLRLLRRNYH
ncbi:MAG: matrixin family metalloprotease [Candidatus Gastranaerophilales bacterium]|nr:matrixin family metalloprotease [Candidatus Gastranaerophilales bacterium]MCM1072848.1 matrixin family metalloprotease [Bacteroides sp.]